MPERVTTRCDQCGQEDSDPKAHVGVVTKHHDCLAFDEKTLVAGSSPVAADIIEACEGGKRGPDLLAYIQELHAQD